jgi:tetratricopeptide (TPR) repeat protein
VLLPLLLIATSASGAADLNAVAAASGRPAECIPMRGRASIWTMARHPKLTRYCQLVAQAHARLATETDSALASARAAEQELPGRAAAQVAIARAALRLGKLNDAVAAFDQALKRDRRSVDSPLALRDLALARRRAGRVAEALDSYRVLVPLASLLPSKSERARVLLEAAHASMAVASRSEGQPNLDEALAYLREASRDPHHPYRADVTLSLVLALDRAGRRDQADALLAEQSLAGWVGRARPDYLAAPEDRDALMALALEPSAPDQAAAKYQAFLSGAGGAGKWRASASERMARLKGARPKPSAAGRAPR